MDNNGLLIIYTGGTIGMSRKDINVEFLINKDEIKSNIINRIAIKKEDKIISTSRIIDSSQFDYLMFNEIVNILEREYSNFRGFLIIGGTDTMAYLQSLLKWQISGLEKPIILTGAIESYDQDENEGVNNINYAIAQLKLHRAQGIVGIAMNKKLLKNPSTKSNSTSKSPYQEITNSYLEKIRLKIFGNTNEINFSMINNLKIEIIYSNPFTYIPDTIDLADGLLVLAYGQGTFKEDCLFKRRVQEYNNLGKPVIVLSQCIENMLDINQYYSGGFLDDLQVQYISGSSIEEGLAYINYLINNNILISQIN
jgi:L-asparaginase